jgi:PhzF family phenazine biosynthesis protein
MTADPATAPIALVDAFADGPFTGNAAALVRLSAPANEDWMQAVAAEMNQAETAYLWPVGDAWSLRWFTPRAEVDLCGHATLAAAHWLAESAPPGTARFRFLTRSGELGARCHGDGRISLDFPALPITPVTPPDDLALALGAVPLSWHGGGSDLLIELDHEEALTDLRPDLARIAAWPVRGVVVTAPSAHPGRDFVSRCFYPTLGIPEDAVTGSAHCALAPWWTARLGRSELVGRQLSRRGGTVHTALVGDRVHLAGRAVVTLRGEVLR